MAENRRLFIANRAGIRVYEVLKETPLMFKVKGLTDSAWESRIYKDHTHIRWTLEDAREDLRKQLTEQVKGQEEDLAKTREVLAKVGQIEPQYSK